MRISHSCPQSHSSTFVFTSFFGRCTKGLRLDDAVVLLDTALVDVYLAAVHTGDDSARRRRLAGRLTRDILALMRYVGMRSSISLVLLRFSSHV